MLRFFLPLVAGILLLAGSARAQTPAPRPDYLPWSATRRLTVADFQMKLKPHSNRMGIHASFNSGLGGNVFELLGKRANYNVVYNQILRSASWIDTTSGNNVAQLVRFEQTLFDIQEVYIRRFRQKAHAAAMKIMLSGTPNVHDLLANEMKECQQRQVDYTQEANYAQVADKQAAWEQQIQTELRELQAFAAKE